MYSNELIVCKEQIGACVSSSSLNIDCDDITSVLTDVIDIAKFKAWFESNLNYFKSKQNPNSYFKKAFITELQKGKFDIDAISLDTSTLIDALRRKGVSVLSDDTAYIEIMWLEILKQGISISDVQKLNHKIIDYMKEGQKFSDYVELVKKSKTLRDYNIDWNKIESDYKEEIELWDKALDGLMEGKL